MLDTRLIGRDEQLVDPLDAAALADPRRQLLGTFQERWLQKVLASTLRDRVQWRILGQQVMFGHLFGPAPDGLSLVPLNTDQWDGYQAARERIFDFVGRFGIENLVVLTADIHSSWASELTPNPFDPSSYNPETGRGALGVEFVTPGITSPGITDQPTAIALGGQLQAVNQHIKYVDLFNRGYMLIDVDPFRVQAEWYHLESILDPVPRETLGAVAQSVAGSNQLTAVEQAAAPKSNSAPRAPVGIEAVRRLFV
jgi:alkaline phosphatase D